MVRKRRKRGARASDAPLARRQIAEFETKIAAMKYNGLRYLTRHLRGQHLSSETSVNKLLRASLEIEMDDFAVELQGQEGVQLQTQTARWDRSSLSWPNVVIGGGTPNIQRNIIGERILGLPKD